MESDETRVFLLCVAELMIVMVGLASVPAALLFQILVPPIIFYDRIGSFHLVPFIVFFVLATIVFATILFVLRQVLIPLLLLAVLVSLAAFVIILAEARLQRHYGDVV